MAAAIVAIAVVTYYLKRRSRKQVEKLLKSNEKSALVRSVTTKQRLSRQKSAKQSKWGQVRDNIMTAMPTASGQDNGQDWYTLVVDTVKRATAMERDFDRVSNVNSRLVDLLNTLGRGDEAQAILKEQQRQDGRMSIVPDLKPAAYQPVAVDDLELAQAAAEEPADAPEPEESAGDGEPGDTRV